MDGGTPSPSSSPEPESEMIGSNGNSNAWWSHDGADDGNDDATITDLSDALPLGD